jgi:23S rRNA (pseudouridine1915-N3)-methyltransferase
MFSLQIRAVGAMQETWHPQAVHSYLQRLTPFARVEIKEIAEGHQGSAKPNLEKARKLEAEALLKNLPVNAIVIALDETGKEVDSRAFAKQIDNWGGTGSPIVFLIGGSWGLDASVRERANAVLSLGKMTLPHAMARIFLVEQLYRAMTILHGKEYHK